MTERPADIAPHPLPAPVDARHAALFGFGLLTAASAAGSFVFACATPFAAFAVVAAAMLPLRPALLVVTGSWLVNQCVGYGVLHYPVNANSIAWGFIIGIAALAATMVASAIIQARSGRRKAATLSIALAAAYAAYELTLIAAVPTLGGSDGFAADIVVRLGALNALWLIGLVASWAVCRRFTPGQPLPAPTPR